MNVFKKHQNSLHTFKLGLWPGFCIGEQSGCTPPQLMLFGAVRALVLKVVERKVREPDKRKHTGDRKRRGED